MARRERRKKKWTLREEVKKVRWSKPSDVPYRRINRHHVRFVWNYCINPKLMGNVIESYREAYRNMQGGLASSKKTVDNAIRIFLNPTIQKMINDQMEVIFKANGVEYGSLVRRQSALIDKLSMTMDAVLEKIKGGTVDKELVGTITSLAKETRESIEIMAEWAGFSSKQAGSSKMPFYDEAAYVEMPRTKVRALSDGAIEAKSVVE